VGTSAGTPTSSQAYPGQVPYSGRTGASNSGRAAPRQGSTYSSATQNQAPYQGSRYQSGRDEARTEGSRGKSLELVAFHTLSREIIPHARIGFGSGLVGWTAENGVRIS